MEIITPEWQYTNTDEFNFDKILSIKEGRRLGATGRGTSIPQAPPLVVRIKADQEGLTSFSAVRADLWCFGAATIDESTKELSKPVSPTSGNKIDIVRGSAPIKCEYNVAKFGSTSSDGYRYAVLKVLVTRAARVHCRKNHVAFRLSVIEKPDGSVWKENDCFPVVRSCRISISEKAMCPRSCVRGKNGHCAVHKPRKRRLRKVENSNKKAKSTTPAQPISIPAEDDSHPKETIPIAIERLSTPTNKLEVSHTSPPTVPTKSVSVPTKDLPALIQPSYSPTTELKLSQLSNSFSWSLPLLLNTLQANKNPPNLTNSLYWSPFLAGLPQITKLTSLASLPAANSSGFPYLKQK